MKGIYLAAYKALHEGHDLVYQDITGERDIPGDMLTVDLAAYDYIIATPPCNWWSRANYRRNRSEYALKTKLLLPCILYKLTLLGKPFIVENVSNLLKFNEYQLLQIKGVAAFKIGRHTYWSNIYFETWDLQRNERENTQYVKFKTQSKRQGGEEVHQVIERFIQNVEKSTYIYYKDLNNY